MPQLWIHGQVIRDVGSAPLFFFLWPWGVVCVMLDVEHGAASRHAFTRYDARSRRTSTSILYSTGNYERDRGRSTECQRRSGKKRRYSGGGQCERGEKEEGVCSAYISTVDKTLSRGVHRGKTNTYMVTVKPVQ